MGVCSFTACRVPMNAQHSSRLVVREETLNEDYIYILKFNIV